jgi:hypothetical protein
MKYMLVIHGSDDAWKKLDRQAADRIGAVHRSLQAELEASGELVDHSELALEDAKIVRSQGGELIVTKGPFTEGNQVVGGYYLVDCRDVERATEIAGRFVEAEFAPIEVRRVSRVTTWDTTTPSTTRRS